MTDSVSRQIQGEPSQTDQPEAGIVRSVALTYSSVDPARASLISMR